MTGNVIISNVDALMYVVSNKAEWEWESVGTTECMMLYARCHTHTEVVITRSNCIYMYECA